MISIRDTTSELLPGLYAVDVASKAGKTPTYWVELVCDAGSLPAQVIADLEQIGFTEESCSFTGQKMPRYEHSLGNKTIAHLVLVKPGSDELELWTPAEHRKNTKSLKSLFLRHGIVICPRRVTLAELL